MLLKNWCLVCLYSSGGKVEFPVRCLDMLKAEKWHNDVVDRLREIPQQCYCCSLYGFCHAIHFKLEYYKELQNSATELELAL